MAYQTLPTQDPNAPPSYEPHVEYTRAGALHYTPSSAQNRAYGSAAFGQSPGPALIDNDDYNWTTSCVMVLFCFFFGGWLSLPLNYLAITMSSSAKEAARRGDAALAQKKAKYALVLNVIAIILYVYVAMTVLYVFFLHYRY